MAPHRRHPRQLGAALAAALAAACAAGSASAATADFGGGALTYTAAGSVANVVTLSVAGGTITLTDGSEGTITLTGGASGHGCSAGAGTLTCPQTGVATIELALGDLGDSVTVDSVERATSIDLGPGDDALVLGTTVSAPANRASLITALVDADGGSGTDGVTLNDFGDSSPDVVSVAADAIGDQGDDTYFGANGRLAYAGFEAIELNGSPSGDIVRVRSTAAGAQTVLKANGGGDVFQVSSDGSGFSGDLDGIDGSLELLGGTGTNTLIVSDRDASAADEAVITASALTGLAPVPIAYSATGTFGGGVTVRATGLADTLAIESTLPGLITAVYGTGGDDVVRVSSDGSGTTGDLDGIAGELGIDGGGGANAILVSDLDETGAGANASATVDATGIAGLAGPADATPIVLSATGGTNHLTLTTSGSPALAEQVSVDAPAGAVVLDLADGADRVFVRTVGKPLTVRGNDGDDAIAIGSAASKLDGITASVTVDGGTGTDTVTVDDAGDPAANVATLAAGSYGAGPTDTLFAPGGALASTAVETVDVRLGDGNDAVRIASTAAGTTTSVAGGGGDDVVAVGDGQSVAGIGGGIVVDGAAGENSLVVDDRAAPGPVTATLDATTIGAAPGDTLLGPGGSITFRNVAAGFLLTGAASDRVRVAGSLTIVVDVGAGDDVISFADGVLVSGSLAGGSGKDTLDYGDWQQPVRVDLGNGDASATSGVSAFEAVLGGAAGDILTTPAQTGARLAGGPGPDVLQGGSGDDVLEGGQGDDLLHGSAGDDLYLPGGGQDAVLDEDGRDTLDLSSYATGVAVDLARASGQRQQLDAAGDALMLTGTIERLVGTPFADVLAGNDAANELLGGAGDDRLGGGQGDDLLDGGDGRDTLVERTTGSLTLGPTTLTGLGTDALASIEAARLTGGPRRNVLTATRFPGRVVLTGLGGNDVLRGGKGADRLVGGAGKDLLVGGPGLDVLLGGAGADTLRARDGKRDTVNGGGGVDTAAVDRKDRLVAVERRA
ncbi:MAG: calcium-binding protein [Thermoleophilia bacterium]